MHMSVYTVRRTYANTYIGKPPTLITALFRMMVSRYLAVSRTVFKVTFMSQSFPVACGFVQIYFVTVTVLM
jgi:hypothetical protein